MIKEGVDIVVIARREIVYLYVDRGMRTLTTVNTISHWLHEVINCK